MVTTYFWQVILVSIYGWCDSQLPRWPPMVSASLYSHFRVVPSQNITELVCVTNKIWQESQYVTSEIKSQGHDCFHSLLSPVDHLFWGRPAARAALAESHTARNWGFLPSSMTGLEVDPLAPGGMTASPAYKSEYDSWGAQDCPATHLLPNSGLRNCRT